MKVYTIIDTWREGDYDECWVANYSTLEEAKKCFFDHVHHHNPEIDDADIEEGFDAALEGVGFPYDPGLGDNGTLFVRQEQIQEKFDPKQMPWA